MKNETWNCLFWKKTTSRFFQKQERLWVFGLSGLVVRETTKPLTHKHDYVYIRARLKPGWERWVFHFTFEWLWIFTRPNQTIRFFPPLFSETLDASRNEGFFFYESLSRLTVEQSISFLNTKAFSPQKMTKALFKFFVQSFCGRYETFETLGSASRTSSLTH